MQNHHGGVIALGGTLYGFHNSIMAALDLPTGKTLWRNRSRKGAITYADGLFYILGEDHVMGWPRPHWPDIASAGVSIFRSGWPSWAHPVVSGGRL
jgi:hypothetical protein